MIRKFAVALAAVAVLGLAAPARAQVMIDPDYSYGYGDWWGSPYASGRWDGDIYAGTVVVRRHHFFPHGRFHHYRPWLGNY
jgi:hypothetical protein